MTIELKPCPFCGEELHFEGAGYEHPYSDACPLDSLYIEDRHITAWNTRADAALRREREPQPDALALVAAAYRDAADWLLDMRAVDDDGNETTPEADVYVTLINGLPKRTPADATSALAAIEHAAYERGVREAADAVPVDRYHASWMAPMLSITRNRILALLTQEGR